MQEKIVVYLHAEDLSHPSWVVIDAELAIQETVTRGEPDSLTQAVQNREVIVLVPAEDVLLTKATVPKLNRSRLFKALPYALEEQLIADVTTLHFAVGSYQTNGELPVAIVALHKMQEWMALLKSWQIEADRLLPTSLALPYEENTWHIVLSDLALVRIDLFQGFACERINLDILLALALKSLAQLPAIHIDNYTDTVFSSTLPMSVKENKQSQSLLVDLAENIQIFPSLNLLQGAFAVKGAKFPQFKKIWQWMSYLAAAWAALLILYPIVSYSILAHRENHLEDAVYDIYKRNFPAANSMVAPKLRMQEKLQKVTSQAGDNRLLLLLGYLGKGITQSPDVKLQHLDFQNNQLTLELTASSADHFSAFTDFLTQQGLSVKQQNANLNGDRVSATVVID